MNQGDINTLSSLYKLMGQDNPYTTVSKFSGEQLGASTLPTAINQNAASQLGNTMLNAPGSTIGPTTGGGFTGVNELKKTPFSLSDLIDINNLQNQTGYNPSDRSILSNDPRYKTYEQNMINKGYINGQNGYGQAFGLNPVMQSLPGILNRLRIKGES